MSTEAGMSLLEQLKKVPDPRIERTRRHELMDMLVIALCAVICGADNWVDVVQFGEAKRAWFADFLKLPNGIASHDTFTRVFQLIDAQELERVCMAWLQSIAGKVEGVVAIDGKSVRGSRNGAMGPLHIVSAWACEASLLLGQVRTQEKSNEITAIPELLKLLSIQGCIVTIDAMGCQKAITQAIVDGKADYVLNLKANHRHLHGEVAAWFQSHTNEHSHTGQGYFEEDASVNNHGRSERRECWLMAVPEHLQRATKHWANLQSIAMVRRQRQEGERSSDETHYYISSLPVEVGAQAIAKAIRSHWAVENSLHWSLDVSFKEDASKVRKDHGPANMACMRRLALTQLKRETSLQKASIQTKRHRAGWDTDYMEKVLGIQTLLI